MAFDRIRANIIASQFIEKGRKPDLIGTVHNGLEKTIDGWKPVKKPQQYSGDDWVLNEAGIKALEKIKVQVGGARIPEKTENYRKYFSKYNLYHYFSKTKDILQSHGLKVSKMELIFDFTGEVSLKMSGPSFEMIRYLKSDPYGENKYVFNHMFQIQDKTLRGKGLAKDMLRTQYEIDKAAGITKVEMFANMKDESPFNGCNVWGSFGFTTDYKHINKVVDQMQAHINSDIYIGDDKSGKKKWYRITERDVNEVRQLVDDYYKVHDLRDRFPMIQINEKVGVERTIALMQKCEWAGMIDYTNEQQRTIWEEKLYGK